MDSTPFLRLAVVGPGRVGQALARRWREAGHELLGFVGPSPAVRAAIEFAGGGRALGRADLTAADAVLVAVQDDRLAAVVGEFEPPGGLWFHASGSHDLAVLQPLLGRGARVGGLHPLCPFPDALRGYANLPGQPAVVLVPPASAEASTEASCAADTATVLSSLATAAGMYPIVTTGGDRLLYHAACVLAANGLTALYAGVERLLAAALPEVATGQIPAALMQAALDSCRDQGPTLALSGPVLRGEVALLGRQVAALQATDPELAVVYRSLMQGAARLAVERGALTGETRDQVEKVLSGDG